jgi:hypothetical protein
MSYDQNTIHGSTQLCALSRHRKTNLSTVFHSELSLDVFMKVVGIDFRFTMAFVSSQSDIHNMRYDQNTMHRLAQSCTSPNLKKINFSTILRLELDIGVFMKDVGNSVRFNFPLVGIY